MGPPPGPLLPHVNLSAHHLLGSDLAARLAGQQPVAGLRHPA